MSNNKVETVEIDYNLVSSTPQLSKVMPFVICSGVFLSICFGNSDFCKSQSKDNKSTLNYSYSYNDRLRDKNEIIPITIKNDVDSEVIEMTDNKITGRELDLFEKFLERSLKNIENKVTNMESKILDIPNKKDVENAIERSELRLQNKIKDLKNWIIGSIVVVLLSILGFIFTHPSIIDNLMKVPD